MGLSSKIAELRKNGVGNLINKRIEEFSSYQQGPPQEWYSELCFCILTSNSKCVTAMAIQNELSYKGFASLPEARIRDAIIKNKHRFHNNKARFIVESRKHIGIKSIIQKMAAEKGEFVARGWLAQNVKGIGLKEASHFMRNVGYKNLAILDRHILKVMVEYGYLKHEPTCLSPKIYLNIEQNFLKMAKKFGMNAAELDLYMWYIRTGQVLK